MSKCGKGSSFEREVCRQLSLWFSEGTADDWFWRSATSGARATTRGKKGLTTTGHCGDIAATCPKAAHFTRVFTVEVKRGYNQDGIHQVMDRPKHLNCHGWELMLDQAVRAMGNAGTPYWLLIHRRDKREIMVTVPCEGLGLASKDISSGTLFTDLSEPVVKARFFLRRTGGPPTLVEVYHLPLSTFLAQADPKTIRQLSRDMRGRK